MRQPETRRNHLERDGTSNELTQKNIKFIGRYCVCNVIAQRNIASTSYYHKELHLRCRQCVLDPALLNTLNRKKTMTSNQNKARVVLLSQHSKRVANHSKTLHRKLFKYGIDVCVISFQMLFIILEISLGIIQKLS